MVTTIDFKASGLQWIDVIDPSPAELQGIAQKYDLHANSVADCLDPEHLPKFERSGELNFVILRAYDEASVADADTVQELTRKAAVFFGPSLVITIHRKDQPYLKALRERWQATPTSAHPLPEILHGLLSGVVASFAPPMDRALDDLELLEMGVFGAQGSKPFKIRQGYYLKRKAFVFRRVLRLMGDLLPRITAGVEIPPQDLQDLREKIDALNFNADELTESAHSLINLHLSLSAQRTNEASHRTNEVVRVLTIFSMFLLPLNVITGIYGMNFEHMPELKWEHGYPMALALMLSVSLALFAWFKRRGWLK